MLVEKVWLFVCPLIHPKCVSIKLRSGIRRSVKFIHNMTYMSLWIWLVMLKAEGVSFEIFPTKIGACNFPECLGMLKLPFTGTRVPIQAHKKNKQSRTIITPPPHFTLAQHKTVRQVPFCWQLPNQDSYIRLPDRKARFVTPENLPPLL